MNRKARNQQQYRVRQRAGQIVVPVVADEANLITFLETRGLLNPVNADDRRAIAEGAARALAEMAKVEP